MKLYNLSKISRRFTGVLRLIKISLALPQEINIQEIIRLARLAEREGYTTIFVTDEGLSRSRPHLTLNFPYFLTSPKLNCFGYKSARAR